MMANMPEKEERMKYTIKVNEVKKGSENLKGVATVVLGDSFKLGNIAIMNDPNRDQLFVSMPAYKTNQVDEQGKQVYKDIFNPITAEFRKELYDNILGAFNELREHQAGNSYRVEINAKETTMPEFSVRVTPYERQDSSIRGLASITIENCLAVNNVAVNESKEGKLYVSMPSYKSKQLDDQGKAVYKDICNPVSGKFHDKLYGSILKSYEQAKEQSKSQEKASVSGKIKENQKSINKKETEEPQKEHSQPSKGEAR